MAAAVAEAGQSKLALRRVRFFEGQVLSGLHSDQIQSEIRIEGCNTRGHHAPAASNNKYHWRAANVSRKCNAASVLGRRVSLDQPCQLASALSAALCK